MIYTTKKSLADVLSAVEKFSRVFIIGCSDCATICATGGEEQVREMARLLQENGKEVTGSAVLDVPCDKRISRLFFNKNRDVFKNTDAILVLSCGSGANCIGQTAPPHASVRIGLDSLFLGAVERIGDFREFCSHCGECRINDSEAICTTTLCPKGLINGPCGGAQGDACEVDPERNCVWITLYKKNPDAPIFHKIVSAVAQSRAGRPNNSKQRMENNDL